MELFIMENGGEQMLRSSELKRAVLQGDHQSKIDWWVRLFFLISCIIGVEESQHLRTLPWTISRDIEILINSKILWLLAFVILYMPVLKQGII